jgi:RND family efflux transporter MFP subunit
MIEMRFNWQLILAIGAALMLSACDKARDITIEPRLVKTVEVLPSNLSEVISQTGEIQAHSETDFSFRVDGRITSRLVSIGTRVSRGDTLALLDDSELANHVTTAQAELASAAAAEQAAKASLDRHDTLFARQIVAKATLDVVSAEWRGSLARKEAAASALASARNKLGFTRLVANEAGVVTAVGANAGQVVGVGQMVVRVAADGAKDAVFNISERLILDATPEIAVHVALTSDPGVSVLGSVREVSPTADPVTRTYRVRIALPDAPAAMTLGATVNGTVEIAGSKSFRVPASAITSKSGSPAVFAVDPATSRLVLKPVTIARYFDAMATVESGLLAGDRIVTAGVSKLRPDQPVKLGESIP